MKRLLNESKLNFTALAKAMDRLDDSDDGMEGRCGNWELRLGGYDHGYGIYYRGQEIGRVNYEYKEYELYDENFISKEQLPEFLNAIEAARFKDVGEHEDDEPDTGPYEIGDQVMWNGAEWTIEDGWFDPVGKHYLYDIKDHAYGGHGSHSGIPEEELTPTDEAEEVVNEEVGIGRNLEEFMARKEKEFKPSGVNPSWDDSEDKIWAVQDYLSMKGEFTDEDREFLRETDPELLSLEDDVDMMNESTRKQKMKFKKIVQEGSEKAEIKKEIKELNHQKRMAMEVGDFGSVEYLQHQIDDLYKKLHSKDDVVKEADEEGDNYTGDTPKIYVGTYAKYNDGSLDGKWVDLTEYSDYDEFLAAMHELHSDEDDPEFMVQDYENFPEKWYHEGGLPTEEEFNKINEYYMMGDDRKEAYEAYVNYTGDDDFDNFQEAYQGHFDSPTDFAYDIVDNLGWYGVGQENIDMYFDYDSFGRDLMYDFHQGDPDNQDSEGNPEDPDHYYDNEGYDQGEYESDTQVAENYVDSLGGVDQLGQETMQNYFDYEAFGRDLLINDYFEEDGYIFRRL